MHTLKYAVRPLAILKYFGQLCLVLAFLTLVPLAVSLLTESYAVSLRYVIVLFTVLALGTGLMLFPAPKKLQTNEAMVISILMFLFTPLVMTWPIMESSGLQFSDALFETISAITTTGLTTASTVADKSSSFLFARAWMQWIGGLGIVALSLAVMIQPGFAARRLGSLEDFEDNLIGGTRAYARQTFMVYVVLTAAGILVLGLMNIGWFDSILYSLAGVSTGGFSPQDTSLAGLESLPARAVVIILSMAGGISLVSYHRLVDKGWRTVSGDRQIQAFLAVCLIMSLFMTLSLHIRNGLDWLQSLEHGTLNAVSAQSTAGFSSLDISGIDNGSKLLLILSMFLGGSVGSTAGGIKILRLLILMNLLYMVLQRAGVPRNAVVEARLGGRRIEPDEVQNALLLVLVFIFLIFFSWIPFVFAGYNPMDSLFEVVSAMGTCGLSVGITSESLHPFLKGILCVDMLLGRLEIIAWLIMFFPGTWFGKRMEE